MTWAAKSFVFAMTLLGGAAMLAIIASMALQFTTLLGAVLMMFGEMTRIGT